MCAAKPRSRPGKLLSYHAISGGFIIAEIVRRVTGKDIRTVLAQEILDPLGFRWGNYGVSAADVERVALELPDRPAGAAAAVHRARARARPSAGPRSPSSPTIRASSPASFRQPTS